MVPIPPFSFKAQPNLAAIPRTCKIPHPLGANFQADFLDNEESANAERCVHGNLSTGPIQGCSRVMVRPTGQVRRRIEKKNAGRPARAEKCSK